MNNQELQIDTQFKDLKNTIVEKIIDLGNDLRQMLSENFGDYTDVDIPNIGITLNNKIFELQHAFEEKGLSFYTSRVNKEGAYYDNMLLSSFVGEAIRTGLYDMCFNPINDLSKFAHQLNTELSTKNKALTASKKENPITAYFSRLWNSLFPSNRNSQENGSDIINELNSHIEQYKESNTKLEKYNLKDNIVDNVVQYIISKEYDPSVVPGLIKENVIPDFEKLGFADLIPKLKEKLIEEYKVLSEKNPIKFYALPDFDKKEEPTSHSLDELHDEAQELISKYSDNDSRE